MTAPVAPTTPAMYIAQYLSEGGVGVYPWVGAPLKNSWPIFIGYEGETGEESIVVADTQGRGDGRNHRTGESIVHPGIQIRIRHPIHEVGYAKTDGIAKLLDTLHNRALVVVGVTRKIVAVTRIGDIMTMGAAEGDRRQNFSINAILTFDA